MSIVRDGDVIDGHKITRANIAEGGTGIICEAKDPQGRRCALKILNRSELISKFLKRFTDEKKSPEEANQLALDRYHKMAERFKNEYQVLIGLRHPHVAQAYHLGFWQDHFYFTSEFVEGQPLATYLRLKEPHEMVPLFVQGLEGLDFIHKNGLVHLDIKSENLLVHTVNGKPVVKIIDFGLAMSPEDYGGEFFGTIPYIAPEIVFGEKEKVDARTDLFSFGVLMYHCITWGEYPYPRTNKRDPATLRRIIAKEKMIYLPCESKRQIKGPRPEYDYLDTIISRLLAKKTEDRFYANARAVINALATRMPDAFQESPDARASYLLPEGNRHIGREEEQMVLDKNLTSLIEGREPTDAVIAVCGKAGMGKSHLLKTLGEKANQHAEKIEILSLSLPAEPQHLEAWSSRLHSSLSHQTKPLLVLVDNVHEQPLFSPLRAVGDIIKVSPVMFVYSIDDERKASPIGRTITLHPFTPADIKAYLQSTPALKKKDIPDRWVDNLYHRTSGIPAELAAHLRELDSKGLLFNVNGEIVVPAAEGIEEEITIGHAPASTRERLLDHYHSLSPVEQRLVEILACWYWRLAPYSLPTKAIVQLVDQTSTSQALHELVRKGLLARDASADTYQFFNRDFMPGLIHAELDPVRRRANHKALADHIASKKDLSEEEQNALEFHRAFESDDIKISEQLIHLSKKLLHQRGNTHLAEELLTRAAELSSGSDSTDIKAEILALQSEVAFYRGQYKRAEEYSREGLKLSKRSFDFYHRLVAIRIEQKRYTEAIALLDEAEGMCESPSSLELPVLINYRALTCLEQSRGSPKSKELLEEAKKLYERGRELEKHLPKPFQKQVDNNYLGLVLKRMGENDAAAAFLRQEIEEHDHNIFSLFPLRLALAEASLAIGKHQEALHEAEEAKKIAETTGIPLQLLLVHEATAKIYHDTDRFDTAIEEDKRCLAASAFIEDEALKKQASINSWNHLGHCYKELKSWDSAIGAFEAAVETGAKGDLLMASLEGLGEVLFYKGDNQRAEEYLLKADEILHNMPANIAIDSYRFRTTKILTEIALQRGDKIQAQSRLQELLIYGESEPRWAKEAEELKQRLAL